MTNQTTGKAPSRKDRVLAFVSANPSVLTGEIAAHFGIDQASISMDLHHLKRDGKVFNERIGNRNIVRWSAIDEDHEGPDDDAPVRPVLSTWAPCHMRHWLDAALFGPAPAQVGA